MQPAVEIVARERLDVVLMDVQMPIVDGTEATRRIRQLPPPAGTMPILALTVSFMASERERYLAAGMNLCLTKPVVLGDLFAALATIAAGVESSTSARSAGESPGTASKPTTEG